MSPGVLQWFRPRGLQPDGACHSTSRGRISGTTDGRTKVGRRRGRWAGRRSGWVIFFPASATRGQFRVACHDYPSASSIKHPRPSPSLPFRQSRCLSLSHLAFLRIYPSLGRTTRGSHVRRNITDGDQRTRVRVRIHDRVNLWRFTHALIRGSRGWWEEADGRRRGACTWCAEIYDTGMSMCGGTPRMRTLRALRVWPAFADGSVT